MKTENKNNNDTVQDDAFGSEAEMTSAPIGQQLKQKREQLGISKKDVADHLCLKESVIDKMEAQAFEENDMTIFIRGYFRSYAKMLDMDEESVLKALENEQLPPATVQKMTSFSRKNQQKKHESRLTIVTWIIALIIIGITVVWWWQNNKNDQLVTEESASAQESVVADYQPPGEALDFSMEDPDSLNTATSGTGLSQNGSSQNESMQNESDLMAENMTDSFDNEDSADINSEPSDSVNVDSNAIDENNNDSNNNDSNNNDASDSNTTNVDDELTEIEKLEPPQLDLSGAEENNAQEAQENVAPNKIVLTFTEVNYLELRNRTTRILFKGYTNFRTLEFTEPMPYYLALDTPVGVTITLGGKEVDLSSYPAGKYFQLKLPK